MKSRRDVRRLGVTLMFTATCAHCDVTTTARFLNARQNLNQQELRTTCPQCCAPLTLHRLHRAPSSRRARTSQRSEHYEVWCQAEGRDRNDREYAARCLLCPREIPWLTKYAGTRAEAWEIARAHHLKTHLTVEW